MFDMRLRSSNNSSGQVQRIGILILSILNWLRILYTLLFNVDGALIGKWCNDYHDHRLINRYRAGARLLLRWWLNEQSESVNIRFNTMIVQLSIAFIHENMIRYLYTNIVLIRSYIFCSLYVMKNCAFKFDCSGESWSWSVAAFFLAKCRDTNVTLDLC